MKRYLIYNPTQSEVEFANFYRKYFEAKNQYTVNPENAIYGFYVELAFNHFFGRKGFEWVGIYDEYRWDFIHENGLTVDCKGKPVKKFPPPLNYHCGLYEIKNKAWAKSDVYVFGAVTIDLTKPKVALVGWEYAKYYRQTSIKHPKGSQPPGFYDVLKYYLYEKEYRDLRTFKKNLA